VPSLFTDQIKELSYICADIAELEHIRAVNGIYVDKTEEVYNIYESPTKYFFCARPRRMGKTLTLNVLKNIYQGKKELFNDTWIIKNKPNLFSEEHRCPVIQFTAPHFSEDQKSWSKVLNQELSREAENHGILIDMNFDPSYNLKHLIREVSKKGNKKTNNEVVVLIDEYDRPISDVIVRLKNNDTSEIKEAREMMCRFYSCLKDYESFIHKCIIFGINKFSRLSVLSGKSINFNAIA